MPSYLNVECLRLPAGITTLLAGLVTGFLLDALGFLADRLADLFDCIAHLLVLTDTLFHEAFGATLLRDDVTAPATETSALSRQEFLFYTDGEDVFALGPNLGDAGGGHAGYRTRSRGRKDCSKERQRIRRSDASTGRLAIEVIYHSVRLLEHRPYLFLESADKLFLDIASKCRACEEVSDRML
ncbi:BQ5605_C018g08728 [Microbotryum silenes-dioicae]|uniref:BQ5605_C018g08728 protein n=1 Tax=Microbotryum silenes-dioicae TaxID=796604 RepID=A0A2X0M0S4_9BASI|nr:BQ5605_C018g08728 [Microbotryum silenes-dioicae]